LPYLRWLRILLVATAAGWLLLPVAGLEWAAAASGTVYLALGDSISFGAGASDPATKGFVPLFRNFLESADGLGTGLTLNAVFAGTSAELLQQVVPQVRQQLQDGQVAVVTITNGAHDLFFSIVPDAADHPCAEGLTSACLERILERI
jgi:lysophospholipase L1-like esterase